VREGTRVGGSPTCNRSWSSARLPGPSARSFLVLHGAADADDGYRDAHPEADRGQRGAGPGLVPSQVAQRQPGRDREAPGDRRQQPHRGPADQQEPDSEGEDPGRHRDVIVDDLVLEAPAEQDEADHDQGHRDEDRPADRPGPRRPGREGLGDRDPGDGPRRPPRRRHGGHHRERHARHDQPPRHLRGLDPVTGGVLEPGRRDDPAGEAERRAHE